ncbi:MAG: aminotransferase class I/II-fold pyridoxal phosphate-dependent enzyme [Myxococcaceae bacterium]|nr:aminotransferase class I/II-fold pyridoxal phosphate-dependent enzyme [Myxococcaceae bacterium]
MPNNGSTPGFGDIAVVGMACRFPHARDVNQLWRVIREGEITFDEIGDQRWKHASFYSPDARAIDKTYVTKGGFVDGVDEFAALHYGLAPRRVQVTDPQHRLLVETVRQALQDAGYEKKALPKSETGVFVGASVSEYKDLLTARLRAVSMIDGTFGDALSPAEADIVRASVADSVPARAFTIAGSLLNMMAATVSQVFDLGGPSFTLDAACSSALVAIHEATVHLRANQCDVALAGGVYLNLTPDNLVGFSRIGAISPSSACRPFDAKADGFVMGEGVGVVVLKRYADAVADGDRIYAVIKGSGCNNDGRGEGPMTPRPEGQMEAMARAHKDVAWPIESIGYVETHGTATTVGDVVEVGALKSFWNKKAGSELTKPSCYLSSIKSNIGHTMSAAGVAGFIKAALVLHHKTIPPQPAVQELNPKLELNRSPFKLSTAAIPFEKNGTPRRAAVSSFGFGGTNAHVLLEEGPEAAQVADAPQLFVLSAPTEELLKKHAAELAGSDALLADGSLADIAKTLASRQTFAVRAAFVARTREELKAKLLSVTGTVVAAPKRLAFLFPGQGLQKVGMLPELAARVRELAGAEVHDALYPRAPFDAEAAQKHLTRTEICQPAMAALGIAMAERLMAFGLKPDVVLGHSLGEFAAAAIAGKISPREAVQLVARRGALMNELGLDDNGQMLAVMADKAAVEPLDPEVVVANHNHPTQVVLSGTTWGIQTAKKRLEGKGLKVSLLDVSHAFHSPLMSGIDDGMRAELKKLSVQEGRLPVISCITGRPLNGDTLDTWARHASAPVNFVSALKACEADVFVQAGAGSTLLSFARGSTAASAFLSGGELLETLGQLFVLGFDVDVRSLSGGSLVTLPPTPLEVQKYWPVERTGRAPHKPLAATGGTPVSQDLVALFRAQLDIIKQQNAALGITDVSVHPERSADAVRTESKGAVVEVAPVKVPNLSNLVAQKAPAVAAPAPKTDDVKPRILASVARISAFPEGTLKLEQSLTGELGFDSLMLVELDQDIGKAWPKLGGLPRELFTPKTTIGDIVAHVTKTLESAPAAGAAEAAAPQGPVRRFAPREVPAKLERLPESVVAFEAPLLVTADKKGIAEALVEELSHRGVRAQLGSSDSPGTFAGVVHVADLMAADDVGPVKNLLALAQKLGEADVFFTVTGHAGALGFTRALAQEWAQSHVRAISLDVGLSAHDAAKALADELFATDTLTEVHLSKAGRTTVELAPVDAKPAAYKVTRDSTVLVTGGAKGLGLQFAKALAKKYGCSITLTGRSAAAADAVAAVKAAGARECRYLSLDAREAGAALGRFDVMVHAAGVLADGPVAKKTLAEAEQVIRTKLPRALLETVKPRLFVGIGSWSGRFGNAFQTDYSAANAMLAQLANVTLELPPIEGSEMVKRIPSFKKQEMVASGVSFLTEDEAAQAFIDVLENGGGEVLVGRSLPKRDVVQRARFPVSRLNHVYLNDHTMNGQRVLPLASALDHAAAAATPGQSFTVTDFKLERPVLVPDTTWLDVQVRANGDVTLSQGDAVSYRGNVGPARGLLEARPIAASSLPLPLEQFYAGITFHGPRLQGITSIEGISDEGITGWVKGCAPTEWIKEPLRSAWAIDPLIIDSSFQLAGYWAWVKEQRAGFPLGFAEYTQLKPFPQGPVKCTVRFGSRSADGFVGDLVWQDVKGEVIASMRGVRGEFKQTSAQPAAAGIDPATYDPAKFPEYEELTERIQMAEAFGLKNPYFSVHERITNDTTVVNGKEMINFSSYNYVGNSGDPVVSAAAKAAIERYGTSVSASRVASGEKPLHRELEAELSKFFGTEDTLVFVSGHATNVTVIGHIVGAQDLILHDALAHDSIIGGAKLSGAKRRPFPHNDWEALDRALTQLRPHYRRVLICIEGTYSMDGDIPDLPKFIEVKKKHGAMLLVDEAHSAGVLGKTGRGVGEYFDVNRADVDMWMGTLSKSFASCGGYICGSKALIEYLKYTTPGFVYSVGISPPNAAAALASLQQILKHPERVAKAQTQAKKFLGLLKARGIDTGMSKDSAVVPAIIGNSLICLQLSDRLKNRGVNVQPILYPAVEESAARLRFFLCSTHTDAQLEKTADILREELTALQREQENDAVA